MREAPYHRNFFIEDYPNHRLSCGREKPTLKSIIISDEPDENPSDNSSALQSSRQTAKRAWTKLSLKALEKNRLGSMPKTPS